MRLIGILLLATLLAPAAHAAQIAIYRNPLGDPEHEWYVGNYIRLDNRRFAYKHRARSRFGEADCGDQRASLTTPEAAVLISGRIEEGDGDRFAQAVAPYATRHGTDVLECPRLVVLLDSGGGSLLEAIDLGRAIAERGLATVVPPATGCVSACVFVLAGGSFPSSTSPNMVAFADARIGLHQPQFTLNGRERRVLSAAPDAPDMAFSLAGAQWTEIYEYMINARRNPFLLQLMLASPQEADRFNDLDSFEELYLAGVQLVAPGTAADMLPEGHLAVTRETARHLCALHMTRLGSQENFANAYATDMSVAVDRHPLVVVGAPESETFCYVTFHYGYDDSDCCEDEEFIVCSFGREAFTSGRLQELPAYILQFVLPDMGDFPIWMFDREYFNRFPVEGETTQETMAGVQRYLNDHWQALCEGIEEFYVADLQALDNSMWLTRDCAAASGFCETGRPFAANLRAAP